MPSSGVSAAAIAARLSAIGLLVRVEEHPLHTSVEAEVPGVLTAELWQEALNAVDPADQFGLLATSLNDCTIWAVVHKTVPSAGDAGGPSRQR
ncbi:hypothetical protein [Streptomyces sp. NPDC058045]|uniref:hypothetical protein n=1 Tax=Streptomyces sp. NPDC058045 TaxID=3346311 RepID=UPI0036EC8343